MPRVFDSLDDFKAAAGEVLGTSDWMTITQEQVNTFADATHDHQWIHVDPERAAKGPFGGTIAHGYLTLALLPAFAEQIYTINGLAFGMNYGANKLRFPNPVPVGCQAARHRDAQGDVRHRDRHAGRRQLRDRDRRRGQARLRRRGRLRHGRCVRWSSPTTPRRRT